MILSATLCRTLVRCLLPMGQGMLSWIADDSFEFEDDVSITPQMPLPNTLQKQSCWRGYIYNQTFYPWSCWTRHVAKTKKNQILHHKQPTEVFRQNHFLNILQIPLLGSRPNSRQVLQKQNSSSF
ncbi:uncharacterized protein LOC121755812 [Salvia splendens]|uniref:uncharacterized protein LOC121755812 n=1 Tax=Salvia splendens TaxID=180675 RepID=UPI001C278662|nr:uncharacterized protein LOC121755812 [Salvia splendens]